jgi:hypothetical protein
VFCPRCGNNNDNTARFCFSCGQRFSQNNQPAGPSGPEWSQFQDPAPSAPPPAPAPPPPPPPVYTPPPNQIASAPAKKATNPALAVAVLAGIAIILGGAYFLTRDDDAPGKVCCALNPRLLETPRSGSAAGGTPGPIDATPAPVIGPGYKLTAMFVSPPTQTAQPTLDKRLFDAIVAGVFWDDAAKLYGRRYPLQFVFNNANTNLLLQRHNPDDAKKQLREAGFTSQGPKIMLAFNPGDRVFAVWLIEQLRGLGYTVVTDANNFSAEEKAKGYYGLILDIVP